MGRLPGSWDPPAWGGPWVGLLLAASVLSSCLQPAPAQTIITPQSPAVGGDVSLAPQPPAQNYVFCKWYRSAITDENRRIFTYIPNTPTQHNGSAHTGRETAGPGCVLNIAGLTLSDTGNYTLQLDLTSGSSPPITVGLRIYEMLPQPTVTPNQTQVLENGTFTLTCNSSPGADTLLWLRDGSDLVTDQRLELSPDNRTLTVLNVSRGDAGAYQCEVRNPVSTNRSEPSTVTVAYGPGSARIDPLGPITHPLGSPLTLTCVSDSVPPSRYRWFHNGTDANETRSSWTFNPTSWAQQGTFACQAHNPDTNLTARASVAVWVVASPTAAPGTSLSAGAIAGIVIGSLAGVALVGGLIYFLCFDRQSKTPRGSDTTPPVYENLPPAAQMGPAAQHGSPPDTGPTYQTLEPGQRDVYDQLRR